MTIQVGSKYNQLTVLSLFRHGAKGKKRMWLCRCSCGKTTTVRGDNLNNGHIKSCGCIVRDRAANRDVGITIQYRREYSAWYGMIRRCTDVDCLDYKYYGARGIVVCERWLSFPNFLADIGPRPASKTSIDR